MDYTTAIKALEAGQSVELVDRDATLSHYTRTVVWLDGEGGLEMAHPTDPKGGRVAAPRDGTYSPTATREANDGSSDDARYTD